MTLKKSLLPLLFLALLGGAGRAQTYQGETLVTPALLANTGGIVPGHAFTVGLRLQQQPGWHTYWEYAGDAGVPTRITWDLPPGFKAGPIQWPVPSRDAEPGDIVVYGYPHDVLLPVEITAPADLHAGQTVTLKAHATWLVCKEICVPGKADLTLTLPVQATALPAHGEAFAAARAQLPRQGKPPFAPAWKRQGAELLLSLRGVALGPDTEFFPLPGDVQIGHPVVSATDSAIHIPLLDEKTPATGIGGVVVLHPASGQEAWEIGHADDTSGATSATMPIPQRGNGSLLGWLGLGFLGGLILNVMPCVLPVIALKIFGFIKQAGESPRRILALGFTFISGIFAWFFVLAGLVVSFKLAGHQLNWAFQFQHPAFVAAMVVVLLLFALNLLGVFEIMLPGRLENQVHELSSREGYAGTFLHGVFATLMATPCTAPFLGPALGFALAQPAPIVFGMFGSVAAGMSLPYAVLAVKPGWLRFLPKPGMWMVRVKQTLGVLLLGTVAWLGWVLWQQATKPADAFPPRLAQARAGDKPVFVDFTADWCVNCKVNEHVVLDSSAVRAAFKDHGVVLLKADWTNGDEAISQELRKFGRAGVPLYVLYPPRGGKPIVLPELISKEIVLNALSQISQAGG